MSPGRPILAEIQGLRAVAVGLVVVFHVWPEILPGGYVGVDVFFVISGYLITGLLARMAIEDGRISLVDFYSRRARRLLPAATVVLMATLAGALVFLPATRWHETAAEIAASAVYMQNWMLAGLSVDYLGAENPASPVQHYWSLSIEEQFYLVWPLVMIGAGLLARRLGVPVKLAFAVALGLIFAASLGAAISLTARNPALAYFATHTRIWELALGGLLALSADRIQGRLGNIARAGTAAIGLAAIACSALLYSAMTPFPGAAALLPTLGAALVILAGDVRLGAFRGLDHPWLHYVGDRSYSIYLWHWPFIVFYGGNLDAMGLAEGIGLIALTLAVSHLSYHFVEQRFRYPLTRAEWRPLGYGTAAIAACVLASGAVQQSIASQAAPMVQEGDPRYPGPAALLSSAPVPEGVRAIPPLAQLRWDLPVVYRDRCHQTLQGTDLLHCVLGDRNGGHTIVVTGDSHAAQWVPALDKIAAARGWKLITFTKAACPLTRVDIVRRGRPNTSCMEWRENAVRKIRELRPDLIFTSQSGYSYIERETMAAGLRSVWSEFIDAGSQVIAIRNTPSLPVGVASCLARRDPKACSAPRREAPSGDIFAHAARSLEGVRVVDLNDGICGAETCDAVVGNVIVWRDHHHLTATYAEALAPYLAQRAGLSAPE